jgi:hypothetical protein
MHKLLPLIIIFFFASSIAHAQLTIKDFKLCLDNVSCTDSILLITKEEILKSKKIVPNYSWFTIDSAWMYFGSYSNDVLTVALPHDEFTKASRIYFERLQPGSIITIEVKGHNRQNKSVDWGTLSIRIIAEH